MLYQKNIRQFLAVVMLLVFAFSITSQKTIHDIVAKHADKIRCDVHKDLPIDQVENASIHCSHDNLVAASPFTDFTITIQLIHPIVIAATNTHLVAFYFSNNRHTLDSRGPPAI
ncbi:MAG: hypothetical protein NTY43_06505 [Bacteroidetes bacterium]|nr:hypothetical protein [Bacteroidota bacterium]